MMNFGKSLHNKEKYASSSVVSMLAHLRRVGSRGWRNRNPEQRVGGRGGWPKALNFFCTKGLNAHKWIYAGSFGHPSAKS